MLAMEQRMLFEQIYGIELPCLPFMALYGLAVAFQGYGHVWSHSTFALCGLKWPCISFLWSYMAFYGLLWQYIVFYRGHAVLLFQVNHA